MPGIRGNQFALQKSTTGQRVSRLSGAFHQSVAQRNKPGAERHETEQEIDGNSFAWARDAFRGRQSVNKRSNHNKSACHAVHAANRKTNK